MYTADPMHHRRSLRAKGPWGPRVAPQAHITHAMVAPQAHITHDTVAPQAHITHDMVAPDAPDPQAHIAQCHDVDMVAPQAHMYITHAMVAPQALRKFLMILPVLK